MANSISTLGQSILNIEQIKNLQVQYSNLTTQLNTGRKAQTFSDFGSGSGAPTTLRARTEINQISIFQNNITNTQNRTGLMLNSIEEFQTQAQIFEDLLFGLSQESLHQEGEDVFAINSVTSTIDLAATYPPSPNAITDLIAANPSLAPPNDQFTITFEDTVGDFPRRELTLDLSDAEAAATGGIDAQAELVGYINNQIASQFPNNGTEYQAVANGNGDGTITIEGFGNITISGLAADGIGTAGLAALGFSEGTTNVSEDLIIGRTSEEIDADLEVIRRQANNLFDYLIDILNVEQNDRFLLGGADTRNKPISNNGILDTALTVQINNWKTGVAGFSTSEFVANLQDRDASTNPNAITDSIVGYNAALSAGNVGGVSVTVNERSELDYTVLANERGFRDVLVGLAVFKNDNLYPLADVYSDPNNTGQPVDNDANGNPLNGVPGATIEEKRDNFFELLNGVRGMVNEALEDINDVRFELETTRARLSEIEATNRDEKAVFDNIVSTNESADINLVAVQINALQLSIEAAYSVTGQTRQLSLVNFLR